MRAKRWSPGKGWIKITERGDLAIWVKPDRDGLFLAAYLPMWEEGHEHLVEHWIIRMPRGCDFLYDILDKPWRIRWLRTSLSLTDRFPGSALWNVEVLLRETKGASHHKRRERWRRTHGAWHRGYFSPFRRRLARPWEIRDFAYDHHLYLPRKVTACLQPGYKELLLWQEWGRLYDIYDRQREEVTGGQHDQAEASVA